MTSEILIMNKDAVAMAADSAATLNTPKPKIFEINKVFALSKKHPVGIMTYQNTTISGVPVETLVKEFRRYGLIDEDKEQGLPTIESYGKKFLDFIKNGYTTQKGKRIPIVTEEAICSNVRSLFYKLWDESMKLIRDEVGRTIQKEMNEDRVQVAVSPKKIIEGHLKKMLEYYTDRCQISDKKYIKNVRKRIDGVCDSDHFSGRMAWSSHPIDPQSYLDFMKEIVAAMIFSGEPFEYTTGIVIAGFGDDQTYPAYIEYNVDGCFWGKLKWKEISRDQVSEDKAAIIKTFAQEDVTKTFLEGIAPRLKNKMMGKFKTILLSANDKNPNMDDAAISKIANEKVFSDFEKDVEYWIKRDYYNPILQSTMFLSKREMSMMAESMINLTTLRRRMSVNSVESVGGPADVAIISKGDGLIWINRKHYFDMGMNPHYDAMG